jgi:hypothetical protein
MARKVDEATGEIVDDGVEEGIFLVGKYLGVKHPAPYTIENRSGVSKPKLGILVYGAEYSVVAADSVELDEVTRGRRPGEVISVQAYPISGRYGLRWSLSPSAGGGWE